MKRNYDSKVISYLSVFLMLFLFVSSAMATTNSAAAIIVKGKVIDDEGLPLPGVSVSVKNEKSAAVTDLNGNYSVSVAGKTSVIMFSFLGFTPQDAMVGERTTINISLKTSQSRLDEVVVVGYGTVKRGDLTGSVGQVSMEDLAKAPVISIDQALAGRVAGVQVSSSDGQPGSGVSITIRGANSITQNNSPLYVVDGFPIEGFDLNTFNPQDIESIEVLKDASSTAIYGARGANGVIMINTKKGKIGAPKTTFTTNQSFSDNIKTKDLMSSYEFLQYQLERDPALGSGASSTPTYTYLTSKNRTLDDYKNYLTTDWQAPFFKSGSLRNYSLAVRGGTKETLYSISGSADKVDGTIVATSYARYQGRLTLDQTLSKKFKVGVNANYAYLSQAGNAVGASTNSGTTNILYSVWGSSPLADIDDNDPIDETTASSNDYKFNPILNQRNLIRDVKGGNLSVNTYLTYTIIPNLVFKTTGVFSNNTTTNESFNNSKTYLGSPITNPGAASGVNGSTSTTKVNNWANENTLTYKRIFQKVHNLELLGGFTQQGNTSSVYGFGATFLPNESLGISGLDEGTVRPLTTAGSSLWNAASFLSRVTYNYNSRYYVTASYRADGSSKFNKDNHWSYFPSTALMWRFTQEKALKSVKWLSDGKLRLSYGQTGNNRVSDFSYLSNAAVTPSSSYAFNNAYLSSIIPLTLANPDLKWETTDQYNAGLDISVFNSRLNLTADVYRKITKNLLLNATLPTSTGYTSAFQNIGSVQNQGLEFALNTVNVTTKNFKWASSFNISFNKNKVLALANNQETLLNAVRWDNGWQNIPGYIAKVGEPLGQMYGYLYNGIYQYSDFNKTSIGTYVLKDNVSTNGNARTSIQPGDIKYTDLNGDGVANSSDYTVIGRSQPIHTGGFSNNFNYKNFDLNVFLQWSYGNNIQNANDMVFNGNGLSRNYLQQYASYNDRWTPTNQGSANYRTGGYFGGGYSSRTVQDGSYLRLKTVSLGYNLPKNMLEKVKISSVRVFASAQNLATWTKYTGLDPEVSSYSSVLTAGFDYSAYPRAHTIAFGLNVTL